MRSTQSPSTDPSPCSSRPSSTKNAVAAARSSTMTPTWSMRWIVARSPSSSVVLRGLGVRLGRVNRARRVLGRRVDRVHLQLAVAGVDHVVPGARGNDDRPVGADVLLEVDLGLRGAKLDPRRALLDAQELVV